MTPPVPPAMRPTAMRATSTRDFILARPFVREDPAWPRASTLILSSSSSQALSVVRSSRRRRATSRRSSLLWSSGQGLIHITPSLAPINDLYERAARFLTGSLRWRGAAPARRPACGARGAPLSRPGRRAGPRPRGLRACRDAAVPRRPAGLRRGPAHRRAHRDGPAAAARVPRPDHPGLPPHRRQARAGLHLAAGAARPGGYRRRPAPRGGHGRMDGRPDRVDARARARRAVRGGDDDGLVVLGAAGRALRGAVRGSAPPVPDVAPRSP